jgi:hypothetical protein
MQLKFKITAMLLPAAVVILVPGTANAQQRFNPGDRVECDWLQNGSFETGVVVPFTNTDLDTSGRWYRVKLDRDKIPNSTVECMTTRLRTANTVPVTEPIAAPVVGAASKEPPPRTAPARPTAPVGAPVKSGPLPPLPGTAWKIDYGRGKTGDVFLFCSTRTWQIVPASGSIGAVGRSWNVTGTTLTTVNRDDGRVQAWKMSGSDGVLVINDGRQTLKLHYNGTTQCR